MGMHMEQGLTVARLLDIILIPGSNAQLRCVAYPAGPFNGKLPNRAVDGDADLSGEIDHSNVTFKVRGPIVIEVTERDSHFIGQETLFHARHQ
jgi:hypothetical protein